VAAVDPTFAQTTEPPLPDGVWHVDPQHSEIGFAVKEMWGLRTVRGVFRAYDGSLQVRDGAAVGELTIEAGSLDTAHDKRDQHLRTPTFFAVERHPRIAFAATGVTAREGGLTVEGELAIRSSRLRLEIPVTVERTADDALRLAGKTTVSRKAAGLGSWSGLGVIRDDAVLHTELTLRRAAS
jgi:polyisoprenoid-binding protein YceI